MIAAAAAILKPCTRSQDLAMKRNAIVRDMNGHFPLFTVNCSFGGRRDCRQCNLDDGTGGQLEVAAVLPGDPELWNSDSQLLAGAGDHWVEPKMENLKSTNNLEEREEIKKRLEAILALPPREMQALG
jgi:hypothetical protein